MEEQKRYEIIRKCLLLLFVDFVATIVWGAVNLGADMKPRFRPQYPAAFADWWIMNGPLLAMFLSLLFCSWALSHRKNKLAATVGFAPAAVIFAYFLLIWLPLRYFN